MSAEISSNGIKLSQFIQVLLYFYLFGPPMALGQRAGDAGTPHACTHIHAKIHM